MIPAPQTSLPVPPFPLFEEDFVTHNFAIMYSAVSSPLLTFSMITIFQATPRLRDSKLQKAQQRSCVVANAASRVTGPCVIYGVGPRERSIAASWNSALRRQGV